MSSIEELLKQLNLSEDSVEELRQAAGQGPMQMMQAIQKLNIPPQLLQQMMAMVMANPGLINELAGKFGLSSDLVEEAKQKMNQFSQVKKEDS